MPPLAEQTGFKCSASKSNTRVSLTDEIAEGTVFDTTTLADLGARTSAQLSMHTSTF